MCTGFRGASAQRQREGLIVVGRANQRVLGGRDGHIQNLITRGIDWIAESNVESHMRGSKEERREQKIALFCESIRNSIPFQPHNAELGLFMETFEFRIFETKPNGIFSQ